MELVDIYRSSYRWNRVSTLGFTLFRVSMIENIENVEKSSKVSEHIFSRNLEYKNYDVHF